MAKSQADGENKVGENMEAAQSKLSSIAEQSIIRRTDNIDFLRGGSSSLMHAIESGQIIHIVLKMLVQRGCKRDYVEKASFKRMT